MFGFARKLMQHKVGVVAVIAFSIFVFSGSGKDSDRNKAVNPWSDAPETSQIAASEEGLTDKVMAAAVKGGDYAAEKLLGDKDLNPITMGADTVNNFETSAQAMNSANN